MNKCVSLIITKGPQGEVETLTSRCSVDYHS